MVSKTNSQYVIHRYPTEHYLTFFDRKSGFFARVEHNGYPEPFWSPAGPELMDISITNWCDRGCSICYRNSNSLGKHMSLDDYERIMVQAHKMNVLQVALGGGNPNQHPDFINILRLTREKYGIVPSYTTNGRGLAKDILQTSKDYCGAVAVSAYEPYHEMEKAIKLLIKYGVKTNIHFVLTNKSVNYAINWLAHPSTILNEINSVIFLNYKPLGKFQNRSLLLRNSDKIKHFFNLAVRQNRFKIGFDSCLVSGIAKFTKIDPRFFDFCDAGRFSMYISEDLKMFPCSFMAGKYPGASVDKNNILDAWQNGVLFKSIRSRAYDETCLACSEFGICKGGCPIFSEINVCR